MKKLTILIAFTLLIFACKENSKNTEEATIESTPKQEQAEERYQPPVAERNANPLELPDPCSLITLEELNQVFDAPSNGVNFKSGQQGPGQEHSKSCFITWEKNGENYGFVLQVMKNPLYGEFDEWATSYINVLSSNGEISYPDNIPHVYEAFNGLGDAGVYNKELGKMYWRLGDKMVVGFIFRNPDQRNRIKKEGLKLGKFIMEKIDVEAL